MIRGTTPTHYFYLPFGREIVASLDICYAQKDKPVLVKSLTDCTYEGNTVSVKLKPEDTLLFTAHRCVEVQVRVHTLGGEVLMSDVVRVSCEKCLFDGV